MPCRLFSDAAMLSPLFSRLRAMRVSAMSAPLLLIPRAAVFYEAFCRHARRYCFLRLLMRRLFITPLMLPYADARHRYFRRYVRCLRATLLPLLIDEAAMRVALTHAAYLFFEMMPRYDALP